MRHEIMWMLARYMAKVRPQQELAHSHSLSSM